MRNPDGTAKASNSYGAPLCPPFFQAPASNTLPLRRSLLISFHFPPGGAAGALRWQKLSHFAAERGWALDVVTLHPSGLDNIDNRRVGGLSPRKKNFWGPNAPLRPGRVERVLLRCFPTLPPPQSAIV